MLNPDQRRRMAINKLREAPGPLDTIAWKATDNTKWHDKDNAINYQIVIDYHSERNSLIGGEGNE